MSVTVDKDKGVTVITIAPNSDSPCPALCQLLKALCYSPACCSVSRELLQACVPGALGTLQIMVGLFNIGLGPGRTSMHPEDLTDLGAAYWLGGVYILSGILCILAGAFPSPCLLGFTAFMNISGALFAITGIVLYSIDAVKSEDAAFWLCDMWRYYNRYDYGGYYGSYSAGTDNPENLMRERLRQEYNDNCQSVAAFAQRLLLSMDITLIVMAVLQLCVNISVAVVVIKALACPRGKGGKGDQDVEHYKPLLKDISSPAA